MLYQAGLQITLAIVALVIIFTFAQPRFEQISTKQGQLLELTDALEKMGQYNTLLRQRLSEIDSFSQANLSRLNTYLPTEIDPAKVADDLVNIAEQNQLTVQDINFTDATEVLTTDGIQVDLTTADPTERANQGQGSASLLAEAARERTAQRFTMNVLGSYEALQATLQDIERNAYPLRVMRLDFSSEGDSVLNQYQLEIDTYAFNP